MPCRGRNGTCLKKKIVRSELKGCLRLPTFTILTSNFTHKLLLPIVSNNSLSTSPVGKGLGLRPVGSGEVAAKSRGIGGRTLLLWDNVEWAVGECDLGEEDPS